MFHRIVAPILLNAVGPLPRSSTFQTILHTMKRRSNQIARATTAACQSHLRGSLRSLSSTCPVYSSSSTTNTERPVLPRLNLDDSTSSLLHDLHLGTGSPQGNDDSRIRGLAGRRRYQRPLIMNEKELEALNEERRIDGQEWIVTEAEDLLASPSKHSEIDAKHKRRFESQTQGGLPNSASGDGPEHEHDPESYGREERRSPAAVFGSKRIGSVVLPEQLLDSIQREIDGKSFSYYQSRHFDAHIPTAGHDDKKLLRQAYLSQQTSKFSSSNSSPHLSSSLQSHLHHENSESCSSGRRKSAVTPLSALVSAAVDLPTEYAVVRNVVREVEARIGTAEWRRLGFGSAARESDVVENDGRRRGFVMWDNGVGSALWCVRKQEGILRKRNADILSPLPTGLSLIPIPFCLRTPCPSQRRKDQPIPYLSTISRARGICLR